MPGVIQLTLELKGSPLTGFGARGLLLQMLRSFDPLQSERLHQAQPKPFSLQVVPGGVRLGVLHPEWMQIFTQAFEAGRTFGGKGVSGRVLLQQNQWNPQLEWVQQALDSPIPEVFEYNFLSATALSSGGQDWPLPIPLFIWNGLFERFLNFFDHPLPPGLRDSFALVQCYRYQTHPATIDMGQGRPRISGFVGKAAFGLKPRMPAAEHVWMLAQLAPFSGVGVKTSYGSGAVQIRK